MNSSSEYRKDLGLLEATSIVISRIIGSGIFRTPAPIMALVASTSLFGLVWALGGLVTVFGAAIYAELVAMMPKSGGPYVYLKEAYNPVWAFIRGWAMFFVSETGAIAAVALVSAEYFNAFWKLVYGAPFHRSIEILLALGTVWALTLVNLYGVYLSGKIQNFLSSLKVFAVAAIIGGAFYGDGSFAHFTDGFLPEHFGFDTLLAIGAALRYSFFAFSGWEGATYVAEEVKEPHRNLPLSLLLGIGGVMLLYFGANSAYLYQLPPEQIAQSKWVAADALTLALGAGGGIFISLAVVLNTFGNVSTQILVKARTWHAMARDGLFFRFMGTLNTTFGTPNNALMAQGVWASVLLLFAAMSSHSYERIIDFFSATGTIFNIMTFYSIVRLRKKYPQMARPYRAWLYPFSVYVVIAIYVVFLVITLITAPLPSLAGLALTSTGFIYYFFVIKRRGSVDE